MLLLNSNPATIMTDKDIADKVYIEPLTTEVVEQLIMKEKPDSVLPTLGGQAGLNLAMELEEAGILAKNNVRLIGTTPLTIKKAEDREMFKGTMEKINEPVAPSEIVESLEDGLAVAEKIGYPVVLRPAYTLGAPAAVSQRTRSSALRSWKRPAPFPCGTGPGGAVYCRLEGDRVRGNARRRRKRDHRLQHGKHRSGGRSYR